MATDLLFFPGEIQMLKCSLKLISKLFYSKTQVAVTKPTEARGENKQSWDIYSRYSDSEDRINNKGGTIGNNEF